MSLLDLEPKILWSYFNEITKVPRPSKKEEKIIAYLEKFAIEKQLQYKKDPCGNVVIIKPATPGYESKQTVIFQGHVDMVCEKNSDKVFNFETDPIETIIDGDWVRANGTTLGGDNGVGVAAMLAILASDIPHGNIECLFTIDEETGLTGAHNLQKGLLTGSILLNLDSEEEGIFYIGCAGGSTGTATFNYHTFAAPNYDYLNIKVSKLKGGHSGCEIHLGLGNANKILVRILLAIRKEFDVKLILILK
jgi:dipeptidase D